MTDTSASSPGAPRRGVRLGTESIPGRRPYQEDAFTAESLPDGRILLAVADGMGGHAAGEVASALALEALRSEVAAGTLLDRAVEIANIRVHAASQEPGREGMGTTLVAILLSNSGFQVANVGDSRAYVVTREGVRQLTEDHSFVAEAIRNGESVEEAMSSRWRDALTRAVGTKPEIEVDLFGPFRMEFGSALLICSDGLYKALPEPELQSTIMESETVESAAAALVSRAYDQGSDDNITVVLADMGLVNPASLTDTARHALEVGLREPTEEQSGAPGKHQPDSPGRQGPSRIRTDDDGESRSQDAAASTHPPSVVFGKKGRKREENRHGWWPFR